MTLVSIIKRRYTYWLSKTITKFKKKKKVVEEQYVKPFHEVVTKE
jgi:hypothetical protein